MVHQNVVIKTVLFPFHALFLAASNEIASILSVAFYAESFSVDWADCKTFCVDATLQNSASFKPRLKTILKPEMKLL